jgi:hypothetical protein
MSSLPGFCISSAPPNERDIDVRRLGDLLDTLIAIRMDVGHNADGIAAAPVLGLQQMREVRALLDHAIASAKEVFDSIHNVERDDALPQRSPTYVHQRTDLLQ